MIGCVTRQLDCSISSLKNLDVKASVFGHSDRVMSVAGICKVQLVHGQSQHDYSKTRQYGD